MKRYFLFLTGMILAAGLSVGCSDSGSTQTEVEETVPLLSEKMTQEEETMMASAKAEGEVEVTPASLETD
ncbi:MAG: hypothetical protein WAO55_16545 [Candidatus Manganitrophaceae bacterium]